MRNVRGIAPKLNNQREIPLRQISAMCASWVLAVALSLASGGASASGTGISLILERTGQSVEIFTNLRAKDLRAIFGVDALGLTGADGRVSYGALRTAGTFDFGDTVVRDVTVSQGDQELLLEAMSIMVHPLDNELPFETPIDGAIAMSVCTVPDPLEPPDIADLDLYGGFITYPPSGYGALTITFPNMIPMEMELLTYSDGAFVERTYLELPANAVVHLPAVAARDAQRSVLQRLFAW